MEEGNECDQICYKIFSKKEMKCGLIVSCTMLSGCPREACSLLGGGSGKEGRLGVELGGVEGGETAVGMCERRINFFLKYKNIFK